MADSPLADSQVPAPIPRPYFIPESVDYEAMPEAVRKALINIVGPAYQDLVEHALTSFERAAGVTLVFLLTLEVLDQFALHPRYPFCCAGHRRGSPAARQDD